MLSLVISLTISPCAFDVVTIGNRSFNLSDLNNCLVRVRYRGGGAFYNYIILNAIKMLPVSQEYFCYQSGDFIMFIENRIFNYYDIIITQIREASHIFCFFLL